MRKRSLSVAYERATKEANTLSYNVSKKFEGVPSDHENDSDSEEENEDREAVLAASGWGPNDYKKLVEQLHSAVQRKDMKKYNTALKKIDWDKVAFDGHTPEEVRAVTNQLLSKIRKHRTLAEMIEDIPQQIQKTFATGAPKRPPSAQNLYIKDKFNVFKEKHPGLKPVDLFKLIYQEFASLSEKKKQKYEAMAAQAKETYKQQLEQFYKENPEAKTQLKETKRRKKRSKGGIKLPKTITPFALFQFEKRTENEDITVAQLRNMWNELEVKKKVKYIQQAFKTQTENKTNSLKLTKEEQRLLEQAKGKPGTFPSSICEYYLRHYAEQDPSMTTLAWRKEKVLEFKSLSKLRKLELEIEYRNAKQDYVTKYESYIEKIDDANARQTEIDLLRSFIQTKMDKHDREQCDGRPMMSLIEASKLEHGMMDYPIAESTMLASSKGKKSKRKANESPVKEQPAAVVPSPQKITLKSILKTTSRPEAVPEVFAVPNTVSSPKKKRKQSASGNESDSSSIAEKKSKLSIVTIPDSEETGRKKDKANGNKSLPTEPVRPPTNALQFYKEKYYHGKPENCEESYKKLSAARKQSMKLEMRAAHKKYFKQLQKFLKSVPQKNIEMYLKKLKRAERACNKSVGSSSSDDDDDDDDANQISAATKGTPKKEPDSSSSSSSEDDDAAEAGRNRNGNTNEVEDEEEEDGSSSDE